MCHSERPQMKCVCATAVWSGALGGRCGLAANIISNHASAKTARTLVISRSTNSARDAMRCDDTNNGWSFNQTRRAAQRNANPSNSRDCAKESAQEQRETLRGIIYGLKVRN